MLSAEQSRAMLAAQSRPRLDPFGQRGAVLLPGYRDLRETRFVRRESDYALLRRLLLYWDVVAWPNINPIDSRMDGEEMMRRIIEGEQVPPELQPLETEGALDVLSMVIQIHTPVGRGLVPPERVITPEFVWSQFEMVYLTYELHEPGQWTIGEDADRFGVPSRATPVSEGALASLVNLLPAPAPGVGHMQIVDFRRARRQELATLRVLLDELNASVLANPGSAQAYGGAHRRLDEAVAAVWRLAEERRFDVVRSTGRVALAFGPEALGALAASVDLTALLHMPLAEAAIAAFGAATAAAGMKYLRHRTANPTGLLGGPTAYLLSAATEGIIEPPL